MDMDREGFCKQTSKAQDTREEGNEELTLPGLITDPVKAHVNALWLFGPNGVGRKSDSTFVVTENKGGGWWYPRLPGVRISPTAIWPLAKTPAYSDSETAAVTTGMRVACTWMAALRKRGSEVPR